jgi:hypothetical protein
MLDGVISRLPFSTHCSRPLLSSDVAGLIILLVCHAKKKYYIVPEKAMVVASR